MTEASGRTAPGVAVVLAQFFEVLARITPRPSHARCSVVRLVVLAAPLALVDLVRRVRADRRAAPPRPSR